MLQPSPNEAATFLRTTPGRQRVSLFFFPLDGLNGARPEVAAWLGDRISYLEYVSTR